MALQEQLWEGSEGSMFVFKLGSSVSVFVSEQGRASTGIVAVPAAPRGSQEQPGSIPALLHRYLVSVVTRLLQLLFLSSKGTFVSQEMAPVCGSSGLAQELLLCSALLCPARAGQQLLRLQGPNPWLARGRRA